MLADIGYIFVYEYKEEEKKMNVFVFFFQKRFPNHSVLISLVNIYFHSNCVFFSQLLLSHLF